LFRDSRCSPTSEAASHAQTKIACGLKKSTNQHLAAPSPLSLLASQASTGKGGGILFVAHRSLDGAHAAAVSHALGVGQFALRVVHPTEGLGLANVCPRPLQGTRVKLRTGAGLRG
jgi:hypothetical protein